MKIKQKIIRKYNTIKKMFNPTIKIAVEKIKGGPVFISSKTFLEIPNRNDVIFYDGKNYKVVYRKFIYLVANNDLDKVVLKVEEIDKKF